MATNNPITNAHYLPSNATSSGVVNNTTGLNNSVGGTTGNSINNNMNQLRTIVTGSNVNKIGTNSALKNASAQAKMLDRHWSRMVYDKVLKESTNEHNRDFKEFRETLFRMIYSSWSMTYIIKMISVYGDADLLKDEKGKLKSKKELAIQMVETLIITLDKEELKTIVGRIEEQQKTVIQTMNNGISSSINSNKTMMQLNNEKNEMAVKAHKAVADAKNMKELRKRLKQSAGYSSFYGRNLLPQFRKELTNILNGMTNMDVAAYFDKLNLVETINADVITKKQMVGAIANITTMYAANMAGKTKGKIIMMNSQYIPVIKELIGMTSFAYIAGTTTISKDKLKEMRKEAKEANARRNVAKKQNRITKKKYGKGFGPRRFLEGIRKFTKYRKSQLKNYGEEYDFLAAKSYEELVDIAEQLNIGTTSYGRQRSSEDLIQAILIRTHGLRRDKNRLAGKIEANGKGLSKFNPFRNAKKLIAKKNSISGMLSGIWGVKNSGSGALIDYVDGFANDEQVYGNVRAMAVHVMNPYIMTTKYKARAKKETEEEKKERLNAEKKEAKKQAKQAKINEKIRLKQEKRDEKARVKKAKEDAKYRKVYAKRKAKEEKQRINMYKKMFKSISRKERREKIDMMMVKAMFKANQILTKTSEVIGDGLDATKDFAKSTYNKAKDGVKAGIHKGKLGLATLSAARAFRKGINNTNLPQIDPFKPAEFNHVGDSYEAREAKFNAIENRESTFQAKLEAMRERRAEGTQRREAKIQARKDKEYSAIWHKAEAERGLMVKPHINKEYRSKFENYLKTKDITPVFVTNIRTMDEQINDKKEEYKTQITILKGLKNIDKNTKDSVSAVKGFFNTEFPLFATSMQILGLANNAAAGYGIAGIAAGLAQLAADAVTNKLTFSSAIKDTPKFATGGRIKGNNMTQFIAGDSLNNKVNEELIRINHETQEVEVKPLNKQEGKQNTRVMSPSERQAPLNIMLSNAIMTYKGSVNGIEGDKQAVKVYPVTPGINDLVKLDNGNNVTLIGLMASMHDRLVGIEALMGADLELQKVIAAKPVASNSGSSTNSNRSVFSGGFPNAMDDILKGN